MRPAGSLAPIEEEARRARCHPAPPVAVPTPLFTRHMVGATEAERDRRLQSRVRGVHRYTSGLREPEHRRAASRRVNPSKFTVVRHLMDRLASELAIGRDLQGRIAGMPASHRRDVLEQYLGETLGHAERVRPGCSELGGSDERAGLGTRLAAVVAGRTRALASASAVRLAGSGGNARSLDEAMDDCAAVAREIAAYVALARLSRLADDDVDRRTWPRRTSPTRNACSSAC